MKLSTISIYVLSTLSSCIAASPVLPRRLVQEPTIVSKVRPADDATPLPSLPFQYLRAKSIDCLHQHGSFADGKPIWFRSESNPAISDQSHFLFLVDTSENQWIIATAPNAVSIRADKIPLLTTADTIFYRQYYERYGLLGNLVPRSWDLCPQEWGCIYRVGAVLVLLWLWMMGINGGGEGWVIWEVQGDDE